MPFIYWDPTYVLVVLAALISLAVSASMNATFRKYQSVRSLSGLTGEQAALRILQAAGIYDVSIRRVSGNLTDHYDPAHKVLRLSDAVYNNASVAAVGVAAHECGHALQHARGYAPLTIRGALVPVANLGSSAGILLFVLGLFFTSSMGDAMLTLGIILFSAAVLFQLVTLPVEFDASSRALRILGDSHMLYEEELRGARKVLSAAALTYVAAAASTILQLLRLVLLFGRRDD